MKYIINTFILLFITSSIIAQKEVVMTQYMYNKYSINPGFAGSHNVLSTYASYRKQWIGFQEAPSGSFFTAHTPLKNEKIALGMQFFNESFGISSNTGFSGSYTYRIFRDNNSTIAFGVSGGLVNYKSNWNDVEYTDFTETYIPDATFGNIEQSSALWVGFGAALYTEKYFAGVSIPSFMYHDRFNSGENSVDFSKIDYLFTGGYLHKFSDHFSLQPSAMLRLNMNDNTYLDLSATAILMNSLMIGTSYRTTNEIIGIVGYQVTPQLRFTYSLDYNIDPIGTYNNGTHEVALQFDFGYKIQSPNPKFF